MASPLQCFISHNLCFTKLIMMFNDFYENIKLKVLLQREQIFSYNFVNIFCIQFMQHLGSIAGDVTSMATIPFDMEVEAHFLAKEDGIIAGIVLAEMVFQEVDPSLKV